MTAEQSLLPLSEGDFLISFSGNSIEYLQKYIAKSSAKSENISKKSHGVRFSVRKAGCSGWMYESKLVESGQESDIVFVAKGIDIYVDPKAKQALNGVVVDYVKQDLGQAKLVYTNPNETAKCGCGESFMMDENNKK